MTVLTTAAQSPASVAPEAASTPGSVTVGRLAVGATAASLLIGAAGVAAYAAVGRHDNIYAPNQFAVGVTGVLVGGFVAFRRPRHPIGWIVLAAGAFSFATFAGSSVLGWMVIHTPDQELLGRVILHSATWGWIVTRGCFVVLVPLTFPSGRPRLRWERALLALGAAAIAVTSIAHSRVWTFEHFAGKPATGTARLAERVEPWSGRAMSVLAVLALVSMLTRVLRLPTPDRRRYLPFAVATVVLVFPAFDSLYGDAFGHKLWSGSDRLEVWTMVALPVVLAEAVLRRHAFGIDVIVRRTTVYAVVVAVAAGVYAGVVWIFSLFVQHGSGAGPVAATGVIAVGVLPLRAWADELVNRRLFGNRDAPYRVVTALGARLEQAPPGDEALHLVASTLCEQLRVPYAAVELTDGDGPTTAAAAGTPTAAVERFPLTYRGEQLGSLIVAHRGERDDFRERERILLGDFARQAGVVAHNAALARALVQSRALLIATREEERRRIRRDLHDGLGPTLATVSLSLGAAADRLNADPELAVLLRDLETEVQEAITDIRRLVYDLRPPVLDEQGLLGALRAQAGQLGTSADSGLPLAIEIEAEGPVRDLPSAVELAAYRVAVEAMTNVVRHAHASSCRVTIERNHQLVVRIEDDGVGIDPRAPRGLGLRSMRERVIELGGSISFEPRAPTGTRVAAALPLEATA